MNRLSQEMFSGLLSGMYSLELLQIKCNWAFEPFEMQS